EFSGRVAGKGSAVTRVDIGDPVTAVPYFNCGTCYACLGGLSNCCVNNQTMGVARAGALQEYIVLPQEYVVHVSDIPLQDIALLEPYGISCHGVTRVRPRDQSRWLIIGGGPIGLLAAFNAELHRPARIVIADIDEQ